MSNVTNPGSTGVNIGNFVTSALGKVSTESTALNDKMNAISGGKKMTAEEMTQLNFEIGQYQVTLSVINNIQSAVVSQTKELSNSIGH
jgi:hypothetical protein